VACGLETAPLYPNNLSYGALEFDDRGGI